MSSISTLRKSFHVEQARQFLNNVYYGKNNMYYFLGFIQPYDNGIDDNPHSSVDTLDYAYGNNLKIRDNILYLKKMQNSNASLVVPRYNWTEGVVYTQWDQTKDMFDPNLPAPFYVYDEESGGVYKCLFNNFGAPSTVKPEGVVYEPLQTPDGYIWKYMYTVEEVKKVKFTSKKYISVQKAIDEHFYTGGEISDIEVEYHGSGYKQESATVVRIIPYDTSANAIDSVPDYGLELVTYPATARPIIDNNGSIVDVTLTPYALISSSSNLVGTCSYTELLSKTNNSIGDIWEVKLTNGSYEYYIWRSDDEYTGTPSWHLCADVGGMGYYSDTINVDQCVRIDDLARPTTDADGKPYENAEFKVVLNNKGNIGKIIVTKGGTGYTHKAAISINIPNSNTHTKTYSTVVNSEGSITSVMVVDTGERYRYIKSVDSSNIYAKPVLKTEVFENISTDKKGHNKYASEGNSAEVVAQVMLNNDDKVNAGLFFKVDSFVINDPGIEYTRKRETELVISGDGTGATATPVVGDDGEIQDVIINSGGTGYTYAYADISSTYGTGAEFTVNIGSNILATDQATVEQLAPEYNGSIFSIVTTRVGTGYHADTVEVEIDGDGTGAMAHAIVDDTGNLTQIVVDSWGNNYTWVDIKIIDDNRDQIGSDRLDIIDWEGYAIIPPVNGHGYDAVTELGGDTVLTYIELKSDVPELKMVNQDYRYLGMITNLRLLDRNKISRISSANVLFSVVVGPCIENTQYITDDELFGANLIDAELFVVLDDTRVRHRIANVYVDDANRYVVKMLQMSSIFYDIKNYISKGATLIYTTPTASYSFNITEVIATPKINKYTGELLTLNQFSPVVLDRLKTIATRSYITF